MLSVPFRCYIYFLKCVYKIYRVVFINYLFFYSYKILYTNIYKHWFKTQHYFSVPSFQVYIDMHTPRVFNFYYLCIISEIIARLFFFWFLYIIYKIDKRKTIKVNESIRPESHSCHFLLPCTTSSVGMYTIRIPPDIPKYSYYQVTNFTGKTNVMSDGYKTFVQRCLFPTDVYRI